MPVNHHYSLDEVNAKGVWLTIGAFDGVHLARRVSLTCPPPLEGDIGLRLSRACCQPFPLSDLLLFDFKDSALRACDRRSVEEHRFVIEIDKQLDLIIQMLLRRPDRLMKPHFQQSYSGS